MSQRKRILTSYVDRGRPGTLRYQNGVLLTVREPPVIAAKPLKAMPRDKGESEGIDVNAALERWARWVIGSLSGAWPQKTLLARVIEYGALGAAQYHYGSLCIVGSVIEHDELCACVEAALIRLAKEEREVVVQSYLSWDPPEAIARELGISRGTYDSRLSRARRSVKDYLDGMRAGVALQEKVG